MKRADTSCPWCSSSLVRREKVIKGQFESIEHYCGQCQRVWWIDENGKRSRSVVSDQSTTASERKLDY